MGTHTSGMRVGRRACAKKDVHLLGESTAICSGRDELNSQFMMRGGWMGGAVS